MKMHRLPTFPQHLLPLAGCLALVSFVGCAERPNTAVDNESSYTSKGPADPVGLPDSPPNAGEVDEANDDAEGEEVAMGDGEEVEIDVDVALRGGPSLPAMGGSRAGGSGEAGSLWGGGSREAGSAGGRMEAGSAAGFWRPPAREAGSGVVVEAGSL